jgi:hypothetical protein
VWILILSIIPCTAPFAALFGTLWYLRNRVAIDALPALHNALCKIGIGVAVGQTTLLAVITVLYEFFGA